MKVRTVIENRFPKRRVRGNKNKLIIAMFILCQTVINQILPFTIGVYFGLTRNVWLFAVFIFMLFFEFRVDTAGKDIKIKIIRGI